MPVSTSTNPLPLAIAHALQWGIPGHGSGRRRRQRPGRTRSPRPKSRLGGITLHDIPQPVDSAALGRPTPSAAPAGWKPGAIDRMVGDQELTAPDGIRRYFGELFAAFPDFALEVLEVSATTG